MNHRHNHHPRRHSSNNTSNNNSNNSNNSNNNTSNFIGTRPTIPVSHFYQRTNVPYQIEQITNRHADLIDDLSYEYSRNMRTYSQSMTDLIDCLRSSQSILNNTLLADSMRISRDASHLPTNNHYNHTSSPVPPLISRQSANRASNINTTRNVNATTTTATNANPNNMLFSYFFYPHDNNTINNVDPNTPTVMTAHQIQRATRTIRYTNNIIANSCPISLEDFTIDESIVQINYCGHVFKTQPLMNWFRRDHRCPVCRANLITSPNVRSRNAENRDINNNNSNNNSSNISNNNSSNISNSNNNNNISNSNNNISNNTENVNVNVNVPPLISPINTTFDPVQTIPSAPNTTDSNELFTNLSRELLTNISRNFGRVLGTDIQTSINTLANNPDIVDLIYSFEIPLTDLSNNYV